MRLCIRPIRAESLFPTALLALLYASPGCPSKPDVLGAHLPSAGPLSWGAQYRAQMLCSLGRTSAIVIILLSVGRLTREVGLDYTMSPPLLPISLWFLIYIFSCGKSFMLVFRSFS